MLLPWGADMLRLASMRDWARLANGKVSLSNFQGLLGQSLGQVGFEEYIFVPHEGHRILQLSGAGARLLEQYDRAQFGQVDPVMRSARRRRHPIGWDARAYLRRAEQELQQALWDCVLTLGYRIGVSVPLHGPQGRFGHLTCLSHSLAAGPRRRHMMEVMVSAMLAATFYEEWLREPEAGVPDLSERETECLYWTNLGKTAWEVGRILGLSTRTVNFHLQKSMRKLNAESKHQACHVARNLGLIGR